jgi:hypothetical protein
MSKAQQDIIKTIDTKWMSRHVAYWDDDESDDHGKRMLLGQGGSHEYKILNPEDFHQDTLNRLMYSDGEVMFEEARTTLEPCVLRQS